MGLYGTIKHTLYYSAVLPLSKLIGARSNEVTHIVEVRNL